MKKTEMYTELKLELAKVNAKLDSVLKMLVDQVPAPQPTSFEQLKDFYALFKGDLSDSGTAQQWREKLTDEDPEEWQY